MWIYKRIPAYIRIPQGLNIYLYLDPYEEVDQLEVNCDGEWLAIGLSLHGGTKDEKNYYSYNPEYAGVEEFAHVQSGGQSIEEIRDIPILPEDRVVFYDERDKSLYAAKMKEEVFFKFIRAIRNR